MTVRDRPLAKQTARLRYHFWTGCRIVLLIGLVISVALASTPGARFAALLVTAFMLHLVCRAAESAAVDLYDSVLFETMDEDE